MADNEPKIHIYPDPDGPARNAVPSNVPLDVASLASGAVAVGVAAVGSGTAPDVYSLLMQAGTESARSGFMFFHSASAGYVAAFIFFGSLSVVLGTVNLILGYRMKERLLKFSQQVSDLCRTKGLIK